MYIEEFLVKLGFDAKGVSKFTGAIKTILNGADAINGSVKKISSDMSNASNSASKNLEEIGDKSEETGKKISKIKVAMLAIIAGMVLYGNKIASAFNSAVDNAKNLYVQKNALFKISNAEINQAAQYKRAMTATGIVIDSIKTKIALNLAPALTDVANGFRRWLIVNKDLVANGITKIIQFAGKAVQVFINVIKFINRIITSTVGWKNALIILGFAWAVFNRALLFSPIGVVIGLITSLMLLIDDLMTYIDGGKSLFGQYWQPLVNGTQTVIRVVKSLWREWRALAVGILTYIGLILATNLFTKTVTGFLKIGKAFKALQAIFMSNPIIAAISIIAMLAYYVYENWDWLSAWFSNFWSNITGVFRDAIKNILMYFGMSEEGAENTINSISAIFSEGFESFISPFRSAWEFVSNLFDIWLDNTTLLVDEIASSFASLGNKIIYPFKFAIDWIKDKFFGVINAVTSKVKGVLSFFGVSFDDNSDIEDKFNDVQVRALPQAGSLSNSTKTVNQGDITNNFTINSSDANVSARETGSLIQDQIANAHNNARSAIGAY